MIGRAAAAFRRTGADLPGGDPRPTHGAEMEGWFWRFTRPDDERVVLALCGINRHADGDWATVAVAAHPDDVVRSAAVVEGVWASSEALRLAAGDVLAADEHAVRVRLDDVALDVSLDEVVGWPLRLGAGGVFASLPWLGQYWQPHILGGRVRGSVTIGGERWSLDGAVPYAEKNWGAGFPDEWWWGQAQAFGDRSLCVAFGGGRLTAGPVGAKVTGAVVRLGEQVVRFAPPTALVRAEVGNGGWRVRATKPGWRLEVAGDGAGRTPAVLPVPLPAERRNVDLDHEHLAGRMQVRLWRAGRLVVDDESHLAALEVGALDPVRSAELRSSVESAPVGSAQ